MTSNIEVTRKQKKWRNQIIRISTQKNSMNSFSIENSSTSQKNTMETLMKKPGPVFTEKCLSLGKNQN